MIYLIWPYEILEMVFRNGNQYNEFPTKNVEKRFLDLFESKKFTKGYFGDL